MKSVGPELTAILARASEKSREALVAAGDEADAWLVEVWTGARSHDPECVTCGRSGPLEDNHVAGYRHGELTVPMCKAECHPAFTEGQDLWDSRWQEKPRTPELDHALLLRGLVDLLRLRSQHVPMNRSGAYVTLAEFIREQYVRAGRRTV